MSHGFRLLGVAVGLNVLFLLLLLVSAAVPTDRLRSRTLEAFDRGALSLEDYRPFDATIGWHQYNDCLILQMISNPGGVWHKALGPTVYHRKNFEEMCGTTRGLVTGSQRPDGLESYPYTRYWHGHNALTALLLPVMSVAAIRDWLRAAVYSSVLALGFVAWRTPGGSRAVALAAATAGGLFWGLPYFAPGLSHGFGDFVVMVGLAGLLLVQQRGISDDGYRLLLVAFGAVTTFMEFLTGLLPTAVAFLLPLAYFRAASVRPSAPERERWRAAIASVLAFGLGVAVTVLLKQALAWLTFGPTVVQEWFGNLRYYTANPAPEGWGALGSVPYAIGRLVYRSSTILTYGNRSAALLLMGLSALAWIAALAMAWRHRSAGTLGPVVACLAGALVILAWITLLPTHTANHGYMVRMLIAPIALGWAALIIAK